MILLTKILPQGILYLLKEYCIYPGDTNNNLLLIIYPLISEAIKDLSTMESSN